MSSTAFPDDTAAAALEAMPDAVIAVDGEGEIRFVNLKAKELTGYSADELIGQKVELLVPQSRQGIHRRDRSNYQIEPTTRHMDAGRALGLRQKDGTIVPVVIGLRPLPGSAGNIVVTTIQDVLAPERQSRETLLLNELGALIAREHEIDKVYALLAKFLPDIFTLDRMAIALTVPDTELVERTFVSGLHVPEGEVGTRTLAPGAFEFASGRLANTSLTGTPENRPVGGARFALAGLRSWLQAPLGDPEDPSGFLSVRSADENAYDTDDLMMLERVAAFVSPAIENAQLYARVQREARERTVLASISRIVTSARDLHDVFGQFADAVRELVPADQIYIGLLSEDGTGFADSYAWGNQEFDRPPTGNAPIAGHPIEILIAGQSSVNIGDHNIAEMSARYPAVQDLRDAGFESMAAVPLTHHREVIGGLIIATTETNAYREQDIKLLEEISAQVTGAVVNSELVGSLDREAKRRHTLAEIGRAVSSSLDISEFFDRFAALAGELIPYDSFVYADFDPERHIVTLRHWNGYDLPPAGDDAGVNATGTIAERAVAAGHAILAAVDSGKPISSHVSHILGDAEKILAEVICVPLTSRNAVFGCLYLGSARKDVLTTEHLNLANQLADQVSGALSNARSNEAALQAEKDRVDSELRSRELERVNEERSTFLSLVSHELKTPLTSLTAFSDILIKNRDANLTERQLAQIEIMRRSARRLDVLIDDLLDVSRLDAGKFRLTRTSFEVKALIEEFRTAFAPVLQAKKQSLDVRYPERAVWINADQNRIAQLISNLVDNASKYSDYGDEIVLSLAVEGGFLSITVEDTGIGMSEETQKSLFTPFFRSDDEYTRSEPGTGLGLVIVKSITELHGGTISVSSKQGVGTTVQVSLPLRGGGTPEE